MKVKFVKELEYYVEYEALEDGVIITDSGDHPTFGIESLRDMKILIKKGSKFQLPKDYISKNELNIILES